MQSGVRLDALRTMVSNIRAIWLFLVFCVCNGGSQFVVEEPRSQAVRTGGNVTLSCSAPASRFTQWVVGNPPHGNLLFSSEDGRVSAVGSELNITAFHASEDANLYSCLVVLPGGNGVYTCPANVSHARITTEFLRSPSPTVAPAGTTVVLHCRSPFSNPVPLLEWRKDGVPLQAGGGLEILPTGNLYLINATRNNTGVYQCIAVNPVTGARRRSVQAQLNITDPTSTPTRPNITLIPTDTEVVVGDTVILECVATGHPTPTISWVRVHSPSLPSSASFPSSARVLSSGALSMGPVAAVDGGRYRCMAENDDGVVEAEAVITIKVPPQVTLPSTSTSITVGDSLTLTCWISGTDQATVIWYKGATLLTTEVVTPSNFSTLSLSPVALNDRGLYECMALNHLGCSHAEVDVTVLEPTEPTITPTSEPQQITVEVIPDKLTLLPGMTANATCSASGWPLPSILWLINGQSLMYTSESTTGREVRGTLSVNQGGTYICIASTNEQLRTAFLNVTEIVVTSPPPTSTQTPTQAMTGSGSILLPSLEVVASPEHIQVPEGQAVNLSCTVTGRRGVTVSWLLDGQEAPGRITTQAERLEVVSTLQLDAVTAAHNGEFECVARESGGESSSATITVTIILRNPRPPTHPPVNVVATWLSNGHIQVQWDALNPSSLPSQLQGYKLNWDIPGAVSQSARGVVPSHQLQYVVTTGLDPQSSYTILVWAYSLGGDGPPTRVQLPPLTILLPSLEVVASPEHIQVPEGQAVNLSCTVTGRRGVTVSWLLDGQEAPGRITTQAERLEVVSTLQLDAVTAAHNGEFECVARESGGESSSATVTVTIILRNPRPPTHPPVNVVATWLSNGHIQVQWDALNPSSLPSQLQGYKLNWDIPGAVSQSARGAVPSHQLQYVVTTGLDPQSSYTILVWAYSLGGDGPPTRVQLPPLRLTTTEGPSHIDTQIISCRSNSPTELQLLWQAGSHDNLTYQLFYGCNMADTVQRMRLDPTSTMVTLTQLLPRCEYWLQVEVFSGSPAPVVSNECHVAMPSGQIDINAHIEWQQNGSVVVRWTRPDHLNDRASLEISVGGRSWEPISSGEHILAELDPSRAHEIELRLSSAQWQGSVNLTVPSASPPTTTDAGENTTELGLVYGVIFGTLLIACAVLVVIILALKYIQMTRRDTDKVINHREKQQETFRRLSLQRSSVSSIKKSPLPNHKTNGNIYM